MKSPLVRILERLLEKTRDTETGQPHLGRLQYRDIHEALTEAGINESSILWEFRWAIQSEMAIGLAQILSDGGPMNPDATLRYEGTTALIKLFREILGAQRDLDEYTERTKPAFEPRVEFEEDDASIEQDR